MVEGKVLRPVVDTRKWSSPMYVEIASLLIISLATLFMAAILPMRDAFSILLKGSSIILGVTAFIASILAYKRYSEALFSVASKLSKGLESWARVTYTRGFFKFSEPLIMAFVKLSRGAGGRGAGADPFFQVDITFYLPKVAVSDLTVKSKWNGSLKIEAKGGSKDIRDEVVRLVGSVCKALKCDAEVSTLIGDTYDYITRSRVKTEATIQFRRVPLSRLSEIVEPVNMIVRVLTKHEGEALINTSTSSYAMKEEEEKKIMVVKADGSKEPFDKEKIYKSCIAAGAPEDVAREIAEEVASKARDGMSTAEIRRMVLVRLREKCPEAADSWAFYDRVVKGRITFENGKFVVVEKGRLYLGRQVKDVGPRGLSHAEEVEGILAEMDEDLEYGVSKRTIQARCYVLYMAVLRSKKMPKEEKEKAIKLINEWREKHGWKPYKPKRQL